MAQVDLYYDLCSRCHSIKENAFVTVETALDNLHSTSNMHGERWQFSDKE